MRKLYFLILIVIPFASAWGQQDPLYNLYQFNQNMINPAYTGTYNVTNATFITRAQWVGIDGSPITHTLNATTSFMRERLGAGMLVVNDRLGVNNNFELQGSFAYKLKFLYSRLSFGMQAGLISYQYNYNKLNLDVVDPTLTANMQPNITRPTIGAGVYYRNERFFAGISMPRMLDVKVEDGVVASTRYKRHLYLSGGMIIDKIQSIKIKPSVLVKMIPGETVSVDLNASVLFLEVLWGGITVRNFNSIRLNAQMEISNKLRFGYMFEMPTSKLTGLAKGTHELMLSVDLEIFREQMALRRYF